MDPSNPTTTRQSASATASPLPHPMQTPTYQQMRAEALCCEWIIKFLLTCLVVFMMVEICLHEYPLQFQVQSVTTTTPFTLTSSNTTTSTAIITAGFQITFLIVRPNYGALHGAANVSVYYHHRPQPLDLEKAAVEYYLNSSSLESLGPGRSGFAPSDVHSRVSVTVMVSAVPVSDDFIAFLVKKDLNKRQEIGITVEISAQYQIGDQLAQLRVICMDVNIGLPSGVMINQPRQCKVALNST